MYLFLFLIFFLFITTLAKPFLHHGKIHKKPSFHAYIKINYIDRPPTSDNLVDALQTIGTQIIVYGETGSGKSTLVQNKLRQIYQNHITTRCHKAITFDQIILDAFDKLEPFYASSKNEKVQKESTKELSAQYIGIKSSIGSKLTSSKSIQQSRLIPPQLTPARLAQFIGEASACWILDNFHKIPDSEKSSISGTLKLFCDASDDYPHVKIIAIGAVDTAREVINYDSEMRNRISEIEVPLMSNREVENILTNGFELLNTTISDEVVERVVTFSGGLASVAHRFGLNLCFASNIEFTQSIHKEATSSSEKKKADITLDDLAIARKKYLDDNSDTLRSIFEKATHDSSRGQYDNYRVILKVLATGPLTGVTASELFDDITELPGYEKYPRRNLTRCLRELMSDERGALIYKSGQDRYRFIEPLHHVYAMAELYGVRNRRGDKKQITFTEESVMRDMFDDISQDVDNLDITYDPSLEEDVMNHDSDI